MNNTINQIQAIFAKFGTAALEKLPEIGIAAIVLCAFVFFSRATRWGIRKLTARWDIDPSLRNLFESLGGALLIAAGIFISAAILFPGLSAGDLVGVLGLSSVAIGFAFKDIFQNFLAGILLLSRRPFHIGDFIETNDLTGFVEDISFRNTVLKTLDGEELIVPNSTIFTNPVRVQTKREKIRNTFSTGIGYNEDVESARQVLTNVLRNCDAILKDPEPMVLVSKHDSSSVNFDIKYWTKSHPKDVLKASDQIATQTKVALDDAGIEIPFPQRVIHIVSDRSSVIADEKATPEASGIAAA